MGSASNGLDALELVERLEPDLLLTDIRMPFISGIELARQVREIRPAMHIAFLSGYDDFEYAKQAIQYNIISYMLKPLTMDGLAAELKSIHEKIDARYAGLRRADASHADRAAFLIPLVLAQYDNAPADPGGTAGAPPPQPAACCAAPMTAARWWCWRPRWRGRLTTRRALPSWWSRALTSTCAILSFTAAAARWRCCWATPPT